MQAFIDGEGSFQFRIADAVSRGKPYLALSPTLEIGHSNHDIKLLKAFVDFFNQGYLKPKYDINSLEAAKTSRIVNRYIVNQLKAERAQDTVEARQKMEEIKASMNKGR